MHVPASSRFSLPLLATGQAQKELFHNEALTLIDFLMHPEVQSIADDPDVLSPAEGQSWIIGASPVGVWAGRENQIAGWSAGGWFYILPVEALQVSLPTDGGKAIFLENTWHYGVSVSDPDGGAIIDVEARAAIESILIALRRFGILSS